jgi:transcription initiation factor TFIID TATA-box-binding protein
MTRVRIENVVASTSLGDHLDLQRIASKVDGAEYEPSAFPGLIYRMKKPKTAVLLFQSGKVVCTGGKSRTEIDESIRTVSALIRATGQKILRNPNIEIQNIVATSNLESELDLNAIALTLGLDRVEYEPEQFPGLVYRLEEPRVVVLLFGSGKLVCTGARRPKDVELAVQQIAAELDHAGLLGRKRPEAAAPTGPPSTPDEPARSENGKASPDPSPPPAENDASATLTV